MKTLKLSLLCLILFSINSTVYSQFFGHRGLGGGFGHGHGGFGHGGHSQHSSSSISGGIIKFGSASSHSGHHGHGFHFRSNDQEVQEEEPMVGYASPSDAPSSFRPNSRSTHLSSAYRYAAPSDSPATYRSTSYSLAPAYGRTIPCPQHILLGCVPIVRNVPCQAPAYGNSY